MLDSNPKYIELIFQDQPKGIVAEAVPGEEYGIIRNVQANMEYKEAASDEWLPIVGTSVTGLTPGKYHVRLKGMGIYMVSGNVELTVPGSKGAE